MSLVLILPALVAPGDALTPPLEAPTLRLVHASVMRDRRGVPVQEVEVFVDRAAFLREARRKKTRGLSADRVAMRVLVSGRVWVGLRFRMLLDASGDLLQRSLLARYRRFWPGPFPEQDPVLKALFAYLHRPIDQGLRIEQGFGPDGSFWMTWAEDRAFLGRSPGLVHAELESGFGPKALDPNLRDEAVKVLTRWMAEAERPQAPSAASKADTSSPR